MYQVKKRNGDLEMFELSKIKSAITRTFEACGRNYQDSIVETLAIKSVANAEKKIKDDVLSVEDIQDSVESILMGYGYEDVSKAYILYRKQHEKARNAKDTVLDYKKTIEGYTNASDWRVKENSSIEYSLGGLILSNSGAMTANYWLSEIYDDEIANAHKNCDIHIHDLSMLSGYCAGWSLKTLIKEGFNGVAKKISSRPAKHLSTICNQMVNFLGTMSLEWAGAQAFNSVDTLLSPFVKAEGLSYKEVKQNIQSLVYGLNISSRWGSQPVFSNFTFDWTVPDDLAELNCIVGGEELDFKYKDCKREMDMINRAFLEVMIDGDADGKSFSYPIPTYSITKEFDWDESVQNNKLLFEMTAKYGTPYFSNYVNSDLDPSSIRSMCPLRSDEKVLVRDDYSGEFHTSEIGNLFDSRSCSEYDIILNGDIKRAKINRFDNLTFYKVTTINGYEFMLSGNHLNLVLGSDIKRTDELTTNDYLPFNTTTIDGTGLTYDDGFMVGAFLGDGSLKDDYCIIYSLNRESKADVLSKVIDIATNKFGAKVKLYDVTSGVGDNGCVNVSIISRYLRGLISEYVSGKALDKELNVKCITRSVDFRKGIVDGYLKTDGGNRNRIYTSSKKAVDSVSTLFASLGTPCRITVDNRDSSTTLSDNPIYTIRPYSVGSQASCRKDVYVKKDGYMWFKIKSIEKDTSKHSVGYCFEVLDDEAPYFMLPCGMVTHNCRLRLDLRELRRKNGGYFGSGDNTGSINVVTINMPRLAYRSKTEEDFYKELSHIMDIAARCCKMKRMALEQYMEQGLYPYTKRYLKSFNDHFSTLGVIGMNEACLNACWIKDTIASEKGKKFSVDVLDFMLNRLPDYQEKYGDMYNLEAVPGEGLTRRFANHDKKDFPDIVTAGDKTDGSPYYTNSSHLPVDYTDDIFEALDHQDDLQTKYTSGTVFHAFLGEKLPNWQSAMMLTRKIAENYRLPYFTFSPTYSICPEHGYIKGEEWTCPHCGKPTEVYSRVTGYYRAVQNFNDGKAHEFKDRKEYKFDSNTLSTPTENECESCKTDFTELPTQVEEETSVGDAVRSILADTRKPMLFTTATCPNCKMAKKFIADAGFDCDVLLAEENVELTKLYNINQAPTLVVFNDGEPQTISNVSNIRKYLDSLK